MKIDAVAFSFAGDKYIGRSYSEMDCQAFVERCMRDCGLREDLSGSNTWYRRMTWTGTPEECVRVFGQIPKGALLFILEHDGKEPAKYRHDGIGNASHIGIVIHRHDGAIHSSHSRGGVCYSEFQDKTIPNGGWNRIGLYNRFDYGKGVDWVLEHIGIGEKPKDEVERMQGTVTAKSGQTVNLRKTKGGDLLERIPVGSTVQIVEYGSEWCKVVAGGLTGWMKTEFIRTDENVPGEDEPVAEDPEISEDFGEDDLDPEPGTVITIRLNATQVAAFYPVMQSIMEQITEQVGRG